MPTKNLCGHLYFLRSMTLDAVKVGFAVNPAQRLSTLQTGNPNKLYISMIVPIETAAERVFHEVMLPHRVSGEWYPDDTFMSCLESNLIEDWGDKVQEANDGSHAAWLRDGDEWENPLDVLLTAAEMRKLLARHIAHYFAMTDDDWDGDPPEPITNHWLAKPKPKVRKLRERLADLRS